MTPTEAIAALGGTVEEARALIQSQRRPHFITETNAILDLALHALTDLGARGALERIRTDVYRLQPQFVGEIDRELAALPPTATVAQPVEPGLSIAETEDSAKVDKDADKLDNSMRRCPLSATSFRVHGHENSGAFIVYGDEIDEAVRIMRTRVDALRQMEKERDACCDDYQKEAVRAEAAEAELARLRAEVKPRDDAKPPFPMQEEYDATEALNSTEHLWRGNVEKLVLWCVRKLGGARG